MENTAINQAQRFTENLLLSFALQEAIEKKSTDLSELEQVLINEMIVQLANHFEPIEA